MFSSQHFPADAAIFAWTLQWEMAGGPFHAAAEIQTSRTALHPTLSDPLTILPLPGTSITPPTGTM